MKNLLSGFSTFRKVTTYVAVIDNGRGLLGYGAGIQYLVTGAVLLVSAGVDAVSRRGALTN